MSIILSRFCKNRISAVTSVPAFFLKVSFGKRIAPTSSARCAMYFLTFEFCLSIVPLDVMNATIPPGLTLSIFFAKK